MYELVYVYEFEGNLEEKVPAVRDEDYIGFWREGRCSFLFYHRPKKHLFDRLCLPFRSELAIRHENWESGTPLAPLKVGRIGIYQPWHRPIPAEFNIALDPNMAFGSGFHASTRGCLTLLDKLFSGRVVRRVLDLGTGTGILSLACLKMGALTAVGVDSNNLAIEAARKNRQLNGLTEKLHLVRGNAEDFLALPADLVIANMHHAVIEPLTRRDDFYTKAFYLVSGLIRTEGGAMRERLEERLDLMESFSENLWFTYLFRERQAPATHAPPA
jgi:ribosomal protein L11 methyltransferase